MVTRNVVFDMCLKSPSVCFSVTLLMLTLLAPQALASKQPRIINGMEAKSAEFPWQVAVSSRNDDLFQGQYCGGTVVHERWIVTAAHCFDPDETQTFVAAGIVDLSNPQGVQLRQVASWTLHPDYDEFTFDNDVALLELTSPIDMTACGDRCQTIDILTPQTAPTHMPLGTSALISGWGNRIQGFNEEEEFDAPHRLEWASVSILDCLNSTDYDPADITGNMFCAGSASAPFRDACQGDSGGPLVVPRTDGTGFVLAGVVSWGTGCGVEDFPGVYARIANYDGWIRSVTNGECCNEVPDAPSDSVVPDPAPVDDGNNVATPETSPEDASDERSKSSGSFNLFAVFGLLGFAVIRHRRLQIKRGK